MSRIIQIIAFLFIILVGATWLYYGKVSINKQSFLKKEIALSEAGNGPKKLILSNEEWKARLTPEQYQILREAGTEPAFSGKYWNFKEKGTYLCAACDLPLFSSSSKYDSGTGWPSFWEPINPVNIAYKDDFSLFIKRKEVLCARCESHIGHVFEDGPPPTGLRYCLNSLALKFQATGKTADKE